ncbi:MAG TPA: polyphenol oxidase family protein, partial [Solirubrobacteraceae bacterium]|nr:polyphenol oxidase family protein [Solirubrobacteraceae bacterium]
MTGFERQAAARDTADRHAAELDDALSFTLPGAAHVLFTTRAQGNLSTQSGDGHERGREARDRLCEGLGLSWLCVSRQVHGSEVQRVGEIGGIAGEPVAIDADGHATALAGVGMTVLAADCLPVALARDGAVAMLHAGWRGLAAGVLEQGVRALAEVDDRDDAGRGERGGGPGERDDDGRGDRHGGVVAVIGPGAGACCYEVGHEVHAAFGARSKTGLRRAARRIDLRAIARERLLEAGVAEVLDAQACTICDERFFSHRREGARA